MDGWRVSMMEYGVWSVEYGVMNEEGITMCSG